MFDSMSFINNSDSLHWILDYDFVENVSKYQMLDNISPILIYDMGRYTEEILMNTNSFYFSSEYFNIEYKMYLDAYVLQYGSSLDLTDDYEKRLSVLASTIQKMYIFNYSDIDLDSIDYYILNWAKINMSNVEFGEFRDNVLLKPYEIESIDFDPEWIIDKE